MTSKRCFFKVMKEDFRHKTWMLVLSILGNMLAIPVTYLLSTQVSYYYGESPASRILRGAANIVSFFSSTLCVTGGIVAIAGALIVGLAGFRYVFHRSMVDTWHSMPVKRRTFFAASWLNGLLIWFVPFLVMLLATMLMGVGKLNNFREAFGAAPDKTEVMTASFAQLTAGVVLREGLLSALALTVAFLLVYHLVLAAVMLCGNVLNALVATGVFGAGAISFYGLWLLFCAYYLDTFVAYTVTGYKAIIYGSPLASAVALIYKRTESYSVKGFDGFWMSLFLNLIIAIGLGLLAAALYSRRPSELAEQGIKKKPVCFVLQLVASLAAGMGFWILFAVISSDIVGAMGATAWGVFGGLLGTIVVFGVMDIVFHMDFKAFFAHRLLMAGTAAAVLLLGFGFAGDWAGYDSYLPDQDKIAEIAVVSNMRIAFSDIQYAEALQEMHYTDTDVIYDFLKTAADYERYGHTQEIDGVIRSEYVTAKVTLKSGRSYYRSYPVFNYDCEAALKLLTSEEYQALCWQVPEWGMEAVSRVILETNDNYLEQRLDSDISREAIREICEAINRDLKEQPKLAILGGERSLCQIRLYSEKEDYIGWNFTVWEEMTHTLEVMRKYGYDSYAEPIAPEDVEEIRLYLDQRYSDLEEDSDLVAMARDKYQVYAETGEETAGAENLFYAPAAVADTADTGYAAGENEQITLTVTDPGEIAELLDLLSYYTNYYTGGAFSTGSVGGIAIVKKDGTAEAVTIFEGTLPEKYILRFGELMK